MFGIKGFPNFPYLFGFVICTFCICNKHRYYDFSHILAAKAALYCLSDGGSSTLQNAFLNRLAQAGATESSCTYNICNKMEEDRGTTIENSQNILGNIVAAIDNVWNVKDALHDALLKELPEDGESITV